MVGESIEIRKVCTGLLSILEVESWDGPRLEDVSAQGQEEWERDRFETFPKRGGETPSVTDFLNGPRTDLGLR